MARFPIPITLPGLHEGRRPALRRPSTAMIVLSVCLGLVGLLGGLALAVPWGPRGSAGPGLIRSSSDQALMGETITRLEGEQADLKQQIATLRDELAQLQQKDAGNKTNLADVQATLAHEQATAGLIPLAGPGVVATYNDSTSASIPPNEDPANYLLHDYDLRDIVNTLWGAGAEAVSVNGERIISSTPVYCVGSTIICNATRLSPPYAVTAIGDPEALEAALRAASQMEPLNRRALIYDLPIDIRKETAVQVPAFSGGLTFHFAQTDDEP